MKRLFAIGLVLASSASVADIELLGTGTGFVINRNHVVTADHVLDDCSKVNVRFGKKVINAQVVARDSSNDLAVLSLETPMDNVAKLRGGKAIRLGETIATYGYPLFGELSDSAKITRGNVNSLAGLGNDSRVIQYDASTQPGNSGGPLLDMSGNVVGVVSHRHTEEANLNFAIKSYLVEVFLRSNDIPYETSKLKEKLELPDIAEKAGKYTVLVGCWSDPTINLHPNYPAVAGKDIHFKGVDEEFAEEEYRVGGEVMRSFATYTCPAEMVVRIENKDRKRITFKSGYCEKESELSDGRKDKERLQGPFSGHTLITERIAGKWKPRLAHGSPTLEQRQSMEANTSRYSAEDVYPDKQLNVGDSWDVPPGAMATVFYSTFFNPSGYGKGQLKEITEYNGFKCAVVDFEGRVAGEIPPNTGMSGTTEVILHVKAFIRLADTLTLYQEMKAESQMALEWLDNGQTVQYRSSSQHKRVSNAIISSE